jgi:exosome complex component RRP42
MIGIETPNIVKERIAEFLKKGNRFDGRKSHEFRDIVIETGVSKNAEGSAKVKIGNTEVVVGVKLSLVEPYPDSADKGNLMTTAELLPLSSPRYETGPPKFPAIELGRVIDRGIRESKFINFEKLCIRVGERVWNVFIDIYSLNDDGNILDAAGIGAIVALKNAKMPKYDEKEDKILYGEFTKEGLPLSDNIPIALTIHKVGESFLTDPTKEEEDASETRVTMGINSEGIISSMQKGESKNLSLDEMNEILDLSLKVYKEIFKKIEKHL